MGLAIAAAGVAALRRYPPQDLPRLAEIAVDWRIVLFGVALSAAVGAVIGLVPAFRAAGTELLAGIRGRRKAAAGTGLRSALSGAQLALALALGIAAIVLVRSFVELRNEPLGFFAADDRVVFQVAFKSDRQ
ncbi:MAG: hypothetical protein R2882_06290 [Gemmatimonadales bacterium]